MGVSPIDPSDTATPFPSRNPGTGDEHASGLLRAISNTGISVLYCDQAHHILWGENVPPVWTRGDVKAKTFRDFLPLDTADRLIAAMQACLSSGKPQRLEIEVPEQQSGTRWFSVWIDADRSNGAMRGVLATAVDITEQKWREQTLRTLLREVAHRSKNLLAIIQSIATQTGRHSGSIDSFMARFRGRLQSLASTQDLVTSSNWRGADLYDLVHGQVARYAADPARSIRFEGERPYLNPNAALHIGLALHELAVNSVSYGALARPDGTVSIRTRLTDGGEDAGLCIVWSEIISVGDQEIGQKRFGSVALERVVPASLNGTAQLSISSESVEYRLVVPHGNFETE